MPPIDAIEVPTGHAVLPRLLPAVQSALAGGPALLPLPGHPQPEQDRLLQSLAPRTPLESADIAMILPTSGSTGTPKGVLLSADALTAAAHAAHSRLGGPGRWLLALPAGRVAGMMVLVRSVVADDEPIVLDLAAGFDPEAFAAAAVRLLTGASGGAAPRAYTSLVPRQLRQVLEAGGAAVEALSALDAVLVGGSAAEEGLVERAREAGVQVVTTYGMTETSGGCVYDGVPLDGVRVRTTTSGRIQIAGPVLASGYRLDPDLSRECFMDGWFTTADLGHVDTAGQVQVDGRADEVAISGGVNVALPGVDVAVASHPQVHTAVSVAVPDPEWGQRVVVGVLPDDPGSPPSEASVQEHVASTHPAAMVPRGVVVLDRVPLVPGGKVDRRAVAEQIHGVGR
ncbi:MAG TPA: o-succinylbenzoate--CoA ligase [Jiangellaceae bacterium]|nr:o-succinylbenzoate--CoA ligase [Jiangellaceae bacterium]